MSPHITEACTPQSPRSTVRETTTTGSPSTTTREETHSPQLEKSPDSDEDPVQPETNKYNFEKLAEDLIKTGKRPLFSALDRCCRGVHGRSKFFSFIDCLLRDEMPGQFLILGI